MLTLPSGVRILVATRPVDFRKGCDRLAALVREALGQDPFSGTIFVFRSKRAQSTTFCIPFSLCDDRLPLASAGRTNLPGLAVSARQGIDMHLHARAA
jgi:hypothetical protein